MKKSELARKDYESGMKYKDIAAKHDVSINTVKSWQRRHNWTRTKIGAPKKPIGAPIGNKNAVGHGAPKGSQNALKHGLFAKYLPQGVHEIYEQLADKQPIDILWENIQLTYANLLHSQRIMFVSDKEDLTALISSDGADVTSYEYHTAWDKQASALNAIARTQAELRNMIKAYDELARSSLVTEEQKLRIEKLKSQIGVDDEQDDKLIEFAKALRGAFDDE
nr:MAG TPA: Small Terminase [Caudoviricetes sp.]